MADELQFFGDFTQTGLTVTARIYDGTGVQTGADVSCPEVGTTAVYVADMPANPAGSYAIRFIADSEVLGSGILEWDGAAEITNRMIDSVADSILADTNELQTNQGDWATATGFATSGQISALNDLSSADVTAATPTSSEIATAVEQAILNEGDGQQVIDAIVQAIGNENITAATIANQVRTELSTELARIDAAISSRQADGSVVDANIVKVNNIDVDGTGTDADPWGP